MLIIDLQYFANVNYFKTLLNDTHIIIEQYENFQKMSFHNRCTISGANGPINLSVPLEGGRTQRSLMKEIRISQKEKWQRAHFRGIVSSYNRSPWFEYYYDELAVLYNTHFDLLLDWDKACLDWTLKCLKVHPDIEYSHEYKKVYEGEGEVDMRGKITPRIPDYPALKAGEKAIMYRQVFEDKTGFVPNLSILDLLFCEGGKTAASILSGK